MKFTGTIFHSTLSSTQLGQSPRTRQAGGLRSVRAFTLTELLIAVLLGTLLMAVIIIMNMFGLRSFAALGNYTDMDRNSQITLDTITREIRQCTALVSFTNSSSIAYLNFTNAFQNYAFSVTYDPSARTLSLAKTGQFAQTTLTECDSWSFNLYQRTPLITSTNMSFFLATNAFGVTDPSFCKLVNMTWKCSRTILGAKVNTESVQTAQIVLREKSN
jgi:hypothetical protein